jgi:hypothetical protein
MTVFACVSFPTPLCCGHDPWLADVGSETQGNGKGRVGRFKGKNLHLWALETTLEGLGM